MHLPLLSAMIFGVSSGIISSLPAPAAGKNPVWGSLLLRDWINK
jgi:hypothetical protein